MYLNNVTLTGFLGGDAETRTSRNNASFAIFSLATKESWKDRERGEWRSRTEWHRAIVFGHLCAMAAALKKGDYIQIQGRLQNREYQKPAEAGNNSPVTRQVTQIRVTSILKLDRSSKQTGSDPDGEAA